MKFPSGTLSLFHRHSAKIQLNIAGIQNKSRKKNREENLRPRYGKMHATQQLKRPFQCRNIWRVKTSTGGILQNKGSMSHLDKLSPPEQAAKHAQTWHIATIKYEDKTWQVM